MNVLLQHGYIYPCSTNCHHGHHVYVGSRMCLLDKTLTPSALCTCGGGVVIMTKGVGF